MNRLQRFARLAFVALTLLVGGGGAHALLPMTSGWGFPNSGGAYTSYPYADPAAACVAGFAGHTPAWNYEGLSGVTANQATCLGNNKPSGGFGTGSALLQVRSSGAPSCPANSTSVSGGCQCNTGYLEQGSACVNANAACQAKLGQTTITNWTAGWQRTPSIGDSAPMIAPNNPGATASACVAGCTQEFETAAPCPTCSAFVSQEPNAQGLYRVSIQFAGRYSGAACTEGPSDAPVKPDNSKDPPCPGYVGEVQGKLGCYGTASKPVQPQSNNIPIGMPQQPGNPPAGISATPGQTPSTGAGGSAGGPAGAGTGPSGSAGTGTVKGSQNGSGRVGTQTGTEQAACGAPGQPVCSVKVDESGMPSSGINNDGLNSAMDNRATAIQTVTSSAGMDTSWGGVPSWFSNSTCSPWHLGTLPYINVAMVIDICVISPYVIAVMSFLWVVGTFFAILAMVGRVTGPGAT